MRNKRVTISQFQISSRTFAETLSLISQWLEEEKPRRVATANLDFLVNARKSPRLSSCLAGADLITADGWPLLALAGLSGQAIPERVCGSDLVPALFEVCAAKGRSVFLLGGAPGSAELTAQRARKMYPTLRVAGVDARKIDIADDASNRRLSRYIHEANPDLILVGLGNPKQEFFLEKWLAATGARVGIGVGASFEFFAGKKRRAPRLVQALNLEWAFRLLQEPRRLMTRYCRNIYFLPRLVLEAVRFQRWKGEGSAGSMV